MADALNQGAAELQGLIRQLGVVSDATCDSLGDTGGDGRDYVSMVHLVEASIGANVGRACTAHREGYLRALTHLLCLIADGAGPAADWNPLVETAAAFGEPTAGQPMAATA